MRICEATIRLIIIDSENRVIMNDKMKKKKKRRKREEGMSADEMR